LTARKRKALGQASSRAGKDESERYPYEGRWLMVQGIQNL
jgi:hypothetical protein